MSAFFRSLPCFLWFFGQTLLAQIIVEPDRASRPFGEALQIQSLSIHVNIHDRLAVTEFDQVFYNPGSQLGEAVFLFPMPEGAHLDQFSMWMNGQEVHAELIDAAKARKIYNDIVRTMRDPGLLEYCGSGLLRASVFPIPPNGTQKVHIRYQELLPLDGGFSQYSWPLRATNQVGASLGQLEIDLKIVQSKELRMVYTPSFELSELKKDAHQGHYQFRAQNYRAAANFEMLVGNEGGSGKVGLEVLCHTRGNEHFFSMTLLPSFQNQALVARDLAFVLDCSGSMAGPKLDQAKRALTFCVNSLNSGDRFGLIAFSTEARSLAPSWLAVNPQNRQKALAFIDELQAIGGTNLQEALQLTTQLGGEGSREQTVILLSDGKPTIGETNEEKLLAQLGSFERLRVFPFGIGYEVNTHLLDKLAERSGGVRAYVGESEDLELKLGSFFSKIQAPVLSHPTLKTQGVSLERYHPRTLPDLFRGQALQILGTYTGSGPATVKLEGELNGQKVQYEYQANFPKSSSAYPFIPALWAQRRVGFLLDQIRLNGEDPELRDEIVRLARAYAIITPYTSYLIVEDKATQPGVRRELSEELVVSGEAREYDQLKEKSGRASVSASEAVKDLSESNYLAKSAPSAQRADAAAVPAPASQLAAGRAFYRVGGFWEDSMLQPNQKLESLIFASPRYFELLAQYPELGPIFALGNQVRFVFAGLAYEIREN